VFLAGESVGANIVHNVAVRAGEVFDDDIDIEGMILLQPYFWGTKWLPCETPYACWRTRGSPPMLLPERIDALWPYVTVGAAANNGDDPRIDPSAEAIASLPCRRALESVATEDVLRGRGRRYAAAWGDSGSHRAATLVESKGVDHCFHLLPEFSSHAETGVLMDRVAMFIAKGKTPPPNTRGCLDGG
jgi:acetyl esterase/lipase